MPRREYQGSLEALCSDVRGLGGLVLERYDRGLRALETQDADLERVGDHGVNVAGRTLYLVENDPALLY